MVPSLKLQECPEDLDAAPVEPLYLEVQHLLLFTQMQQLQGLVDPALPRLCQSEQAPQELLALHSGLQHPEQVSQPQLPMGCQQHGLQAPGDLLLGLAL